MASTLSVSRPTSILQGPFSQPWKSSDLVLIVEGRNFHVHRAVLILCSLVFENVLTSNLEEQYVLQIQLPDKKADEFEQLLQAIYPDRDFFITKENCFFLLKFATEYQIDRLKARCEEYVSEWSNTNMTRNQAIRVIVFSQKYPLSDNLVKRCAEIFVSSESSTWGELKQHKLYSRLDPVNVQRITDQRMRYMEEWLGIGPYCGANGSRNSRRHYPAIRELTY